MKFSLVHLSGSHRGETQYFDRSRLTLGSDPSSDMVFPTNERRPIASLHAELFQTECDIRLRNLDPQARTLVNQKPVSEAILQDKDLIQLGPHGPKLRFRIRPEEYVACKLVREILQDARDVAAAGQEEGLGPIRSFVGQLAYDMRRHASRAVQLAVGALIILLAGIAVSALTYTYATRLAYERHVAALLRELESARLTQADLERRTAEEQKRVAESVATREAETARLLAVLKEQRRQGASSEDIRTLTERLKMLELERTGAEGLIKQYGASVCFLYATYGFVEQQRADEEPAVLLASMGTGFLVDSKGLIVTNRHIMQPWTMDPSETEIEMVKRGLIPKLVAMHAFFPGRSEPYPVAVIRLSDAADVALGRLSSAPKDIPQIPIRKPAPSGISGEAVVVLGYPVGIEGILARMDDKEAEALLRKPGNDLRRLVQDIADRGGIRPLATQGHIGDVVPGRIIYDAQTTGGSSGSPVFNSQGEVIAVNAATMIRFKGASFGVPISFVLDLVPSTG